MYDVGIPIWSQLIVILICIIIAALSYNKSSFIFALPLAIVLTLYPIILIKLGITELTNTEINKYLSLYTLTYIVIKFIIQYIINLISLKLATRFSSGQTTHIRYVIIYLIVIKVITTILTYTALNAL